MSDFDRKMGVEEFLRAVRIRSCDLCALAAVGASAMSAARKHGTASKKNAQKIAAVTGGRVVLHLAASRPISPIDCEAMRAARRGREERIPPGRPSLTARAA